MSFTSWLVCSRQVGSNYPPSYVELGCWSLPLTCPVNYFEGAIQSLIHLGRNTVPDHNKGCKIAGTE